MRYSLMVKSVQQGADAGKAKAPNPAMFTRRGTVPLDEGREWSGDKYDEGPVSNPDEAYAHFTDPQDPNVEAWLDKHEDGTLIGWVRQGREIWRYSDPEAWALDVDGAHMERTDPGAASAPANVMPENDTHEPDTGQDPQADPTAADPHIGEQGGNGFLEEPDKATTEGDPTQQVADPRQLPADGGEAATEDPTGQEDGEFENPFADYTTDATGDGTTPDQEQQKQQAEQDAAQAQEQPEDQPADGNTAGAEQATSGNTPDAAPEETPDPNDNPFTDEKPGEKPGDSPADAEPDADTDETDPKKKKAKKKPPFQTKSLRGRGYQIAVKHLPGKHDQRTHGDWAHDGIASKIGSEVAHALKEGANALDGGGSGGSGSGGGSSRPKGGEAPKKASVKPSTIAHMDTKDLEALMESGDHYDLATVQAACDELDKRDSIDARTRAFAGHTEPGSPERQALFDAVIPDMWAQWAAGSKRKSQTQAQEIEGAYQDWALSQYDQALEATNGQMFAAKYRSNPPFDALSWFTGEARRGNKLRKYGSEELQRFFADHPPMTLSDFKADRYESYAKAKRQVGSRYLSEHG